MELYLSKSIFSTGVFWDIIRRDLRNNKDALIWIIKEKE